MLAGAAGEALGRALAGAERLGFAFELALEPEEGLASFPWETLRLPGLGGLPGEPLALHPNVRLFRAVSGLLRGGESRFPDVVERMELALEKKGVRHPEAWLRRTKGNLDQALAETVTLAVDDVLLDRLLEKLEGVPLAKELLLGAAVYRVPVDLLGLAWQVGGGD